MKLEYCPDVDVLALRWSDAPVAETRDSAARALGDFDADARLVGGTLSEASHDRDLPALPQSLLERVAGEPASVETAIGPPVSITGAVVVSLR